MILQCFGAISARRRIFGPSLRGIHSYTKGERVLAEWNGIWWDAKIKQITENGYLVNISDWSEPWEEDIPASAGRIASSVDSIDNLATLPTTSSSAPDKSTLVTTKLSASNPDRLVVTIQANGRTFLSSRLRDGRLVFKDPISGLLSWSVPEQPAIPKESKRAAPQQPTSPKQTKRTIPDLPKGFIERTDLLGNSYFFNTVNGRAQYERPRFSGSKVAKNMALAEGVDAKSIVPWELYFDQDGVPFYHNIETGETRTSLPNNVTESKNTPSKIGVDNVTSKVLSEASQDNATSKVLESDIKTSQKSVGSKVVVDNVALPDGWEVHYTDDGHPYYFCISTGESHWELPTVSNDEEWWVPRETKTNRSGLGS